MTNHNTRSGLILICTLWCVLFGNEIKAQQKCPNSLRVCTQNLFNFGTGTKTAQALQKQRLLERFLAAGCDVIALQEVIGSSITEAKRTIQPLADDLGKARARKVEVVLGESNDPRIRNAFLVVAGDFKIGKSESFAARKIDSVDGEEHFRRGPLGLSLSHGARSIYLLNIHLKSQSDAEKDPRGLRFEALRVSMAEQVRQIAEGKVKNFGAKGVVLVLGDRNSNEQSATAQVLAGQLRFSDFSTACTINNSLQPKCVSSPKHEANFVPLFQESSMRFPSLIRLGSHLFQNKASQLDEIYVSADDLDMFQGLGNIPNIGFVGRFFYGSDHLLLWTELKWD